MKRHRYFVPILTALVVLWLWRELPKLTLNLSKGEPFGVLGAMWLLSLILLPLSCAGLWLRPLWGLIPAALSLCLMILVEGKGLLHDPHETIGVQVLAVAFSLIAMAVKQTQPQENKVPENIGTNAPNSQH